MEVSGFVSTDTSDKTYAKSKKSIVSAVTIDGKRYFKKQLSPNIKDDLRHRMAMYKEYETGNHLECPYIVKYVGINEDENGLYVLMEHVNGINLAEKICAEPEYFQNHRHTKKVLLQLLKALKTLHKLNIAYLDLKPENVMLTQISNDVKLTDLGGCLTDYNDYTAERTNKFAAPELLEGKTELLDARTDIYSLGKLLEYIEKHANTKLPKRLDRIKERCLNEDKAERYESVDDIIKLLDNRKHKIWGFTAVIALIIAATAGWQWYETTDHHEQLTLRMESDITLDNIYYKIISEDSATCKVIGRVNDVSNILIAEDVIIDGKTYKTVEIADSAFSGYTALKSVQFPSSLRRIGEKAFFECKSLAIVSIPEGVATIERYCFKGAGLQNLKLPNTLKTIGHAAFAQCKMLLDVEIPEGVISLELDAFGDCHSLKTVKLPSTLKAINRGVFWSCNSLEEIRIPANVETIGDFVFYYCTSLKNIYNYSPKPQVLSRILTIDNIHEMTLHVPAGSENEYRNAIGWNELNIAGDL